VSFDVLAPLITTTTTTTKTTTTITTTTEFTLEMKKISIVYWR
jgi:hypothetical protein